MSYFVHRSLPAQQKKLRLIQLLPEDEFVFLKAPSSESQPRPLFANPKDPEDRICCSIFHTSLDDAPPFQAISCTWGDASKKKEIILNGAIMEVHENLEAVLRHLVPEDEPLTLWVDALCIDSSDEIEESEQVQLKDEIYARSTSVLVWLGLEADGSDLAMDWIEEYGSRAVALGVTEEEPGLQLNHILETFNKPSVSDTTAQLSPEIRTFVQDLERELSPSNPKHAILTSAFRKFLSRPYFARSGKVQENAPSTQKEIYVCGSKQSSGDTLNCAITLLKNLPDMGVV